MEYEWCKQPDRGLPEPDLVIFLDIDIEEAAKRSNYGEERYEKKDVQTQVLKQFDRLIEDDQKSTQRFVKVDAAQSKDNVHSRVWELTQKTIENCKEKIITKLWW